MDEITDEEIAANYTAMGHSVDLINDIVAGNRDDRMDAEQRQDAVDRNVEHLELMVAQDYWTNQSMTAVNSAITSGNGYTAE